MQSCPLDVAHHSGKGLGRISGSKTRVSVDRSFTLMSVLMSTYIKARLQPLTKTLGHQNLNRLQHFPSVLCRTPSMYQDTKITHDFDASFINVSGRGLSLFWALRQ